MKQVQNNSRNRKRFLTFDFFPITKTHVQFVIYYKLVKLMVTYRHTQQHKRTRECINAMQRNQIIKS